MLSIVLVICRHYLDEFFLKKYTLPLCWGNWAIDKFTNLQETFLVNSQCVVMLGFKPFSPVPGYLLHCALFLDALNYHE